MGMIFAWLHRAWLGVAVVVMVAAGFGWMAKNVDQPAMLIERLCAYRAAIQIEREREKIEPGELDRLLTGMGRLCRGETSPY